MIEIDIPKDITKYETKLIGPFSKRELIGIGVAAILGYAAYYVSKAYGLPKDVCGILTLVFAAPGILYGWFTYNGMRIEQLLYTFLVYVFLAPKNRKYLCETKFDQRYAKIQENKLKKNPKKFKYEQERIKLNKKKPKIKKNKNPDLVGYL